MSKYRDASSARSGSCFPCRRPSASAANLAPLMYGSSCSKGRGRSPRAMSVSFANRVEQLIVCRPVSEIAAHVRPGDRSILPDGKDRRLGNRLAVVPYAPLLDHAALGITEQWERQQQLFHHRVIVLNGIDRDPGEAHALMVEAVPVPGVRGQLPVAVGSPIPSVEHEQDRAAGKVVGEAPGLAFLVG